MFAQRDSSTLSVSARDRLRPLILLPTGVSKGRQWAVNHLTDAVSSWQCLV